MSLLPPSTAFVQLCLSQCIPLVWLLCFLLFLVATAIAKISLFTHFPAQFSADCCFIQFFSASHSPSHILIDLNVIHVILWASNDPPFSRPELVNQPVTPSVHLFVTLMVILTTTASGSVTPTPPPMVQAYVMVLVGFGSDWTAIWRLSTVSLGWGGGGCNLSSINAEKRALSPKKEWSHSTFCLRSYKFN